MKTSMIQRFIDRVKTEHVEKTQKTRNELLYARRLLERVKQEGLSERVRNHVLLVARTFADRGALPREEYAELEDEIGLPVINVMRKKIIVCLGWRGDFMAGTIRDLKDDYADVEFLAVVKNWLRQRSDEIEYAVIPTSDNEFYYGRVAGAQDVRAVLPVFFMPDHFDRTCYYDSSETLDSVFSSKLQTQEILNKEGIATPDSFRWNQLSDKVLKSFGDDEILVLKVDNVDGSDGVFYVTKTELVALLRGELSKLAADLQKFPKDKLFIQKKINCPTVLLEGQSMHWCLRVFLTFDEDGTSTMNGITVRVNQPNVPANFCQGALGLRFEDLCMHLGADPEQFKKKLGDFSVSASECLNRHFSHMALESENLERRPIRFLNLDLMVDEAWNPYVLEVGQLASGSLRMLSMPEQKRIYERHFRNIIQSIR